MPESFRILLNEPKSELGNLFEKNKLFSVVFKPDSDFNGEHLMDLLLKNDPKKIVKAQISDDLFQSFSKYELAAGSALLSYIDKIFPSDIKPMFRIPELKHGNHMVLDSTALHALEIIKTSKEQLKKVRD